MTSRLVCVLLFLLLPEAVSAQPSAAAPSLKAGMDTAVLPGNNFYLYANGAWMKATEIPQDQASWGPGQALAEEVDRQTSELLEKASAAPAGSDARKAGDYYATYMDESAIEKLGLKPLGPALQEVAQVKDKKSLAHYLGAHLRADVDPLNASNFYTPHLFGLFVSPDLNTPGRNTAYLLQGGLGLPERTYYLDASPRMADIRAKYRAYIAALLKLAHIPDAEAKAARIFALELKMARAHVSREDSEDIQKANNPWKQADFAKQAPGLDWASYFAAAGLLKQPVLVVWHPAATVGLSALVAKEPLSTWKEYLAFEAINSGAALLPKAFVEARFGLYGNTLGGTPQLSVRWKRAVAATNAALGDAVGQLYVKRYFPPEAKAQVQAMVKDIIAAFSKRIDSLDWMAPETKVKAKEKLSTLYVGVGYPEKWVDYANLEVVPGEALGNAQRSGLFEYHRRLAQLGQPVDFSEWWMTPQTVNAVNMPLQNALNFPAAILQPPYFDARASAAFNYAATGATIGHEISHSFDDQGSQFDAHGRLSNWWTKEDLAHFQASSAQLAAQYDGYHPFPDLAVNGKQTLSENIADLAGLSAAYDAWQISLGNKPAPGAEGFTGVQEFFLSYAQAWRSKEREALLRQQIITDGHAPDEYRADIVRNLDAWYPAFEVKAPQTLYLAPKDRIRVW
jgi:putative endopeptidase